MVRAAFWGWSIRTPLPAFEASGPSGERAGVETLDRTEVVSFRAQESALSIALTFGSRPVQSFCANTPW